jgi:hypothetical protein
VEHLKGASLGQALGLFTNMGPGWKAYHGQAVIMNTHTLWPQKDFKIGSWGCVHNISITSELMNGPNKL